MGPKLNTGSNRDGWISMCFIQIPDIKKMQHAKEHIFIHMAHDKHWIVT